MASIAAIKIVQKELGLSDADYRRLLMDVTGFASSTQLNDAGLKAMLTALYRMRDKQTQAASQTRGASERKLWALWYDLRKYLPMEERDVRYFVGMVCRASGARIDGTHGLGDLTPSQYYKAIEALKRRRDAEADRADPVPF